MNQPTDIPFTCDCQHGETRRIAWNRVEHRCHRPSQSYSQTGAFVPKVADVRGRWWTDWKSTPVNAK